MEDFTEKCLNAKRESRSIEFKERFSPNDKGELAEIVKDIVSLANTGGGAIGVGFDNHGMPVGADLVDVLRFDPAKITDVIRSYTGEHFADVQVLSANKDGLTVALIIVGESESPLVFEKVGSYRTPEGKDKTAFVQGALYVRHGAKSEPATSADLRRIIEQKLENTRKRWMDGLKKVVEAPSDAEISVAYPAVYVGKLDSSAEAQPFQPTFDETKPYVLVSDPNQSHPLRQKEVIAQLKPRLPEDSGLTTHTLLAVRRLYKIDDDERFVYKPLYGSPQYSAAFVDWLIEKIRKDSDFFWKARQEYAT